MLAGKVSWPTYLRLTANRHFTLLPAWSSRSGLAGRVQYGLVLPEEFEGPACGLGEPRLSAKLPGFAGRTPAKAQEASPVLSDVGAAAAAAVVGVRCQSGAAAVHRLHPELRAQHPGPAHPLLGLAAAPRPLHDRAWCALATRRPQPGGAAAVERDRRRRPDSAVRRHTHRRAVPRGCRELQRRDRAQLH